jgi:hypothetical protein
MRMACVGDVVLLDHPADATGPRSVDCYLTKVLDFAAAAAGGADARRLKLGPDRLLYSLQWRRDAAPADLRLRLAKDPDLWLECIVNLLLETLAQHDPGLRDRLA